MADFHAVTQEEARENPSVAIEGEGDFGALFQLSPYSEYVGLAFQEWYGWANNSVFFQRVDPIMLPFFSMVNNWDRWVNGYVPGFHSFSSGVVPTGLSKVIVDKVAALIYGGGILFSAGGNGDADKQARDFLANEWAEKTGFKSALQSAIRMACSLGTASLKLNASTGADRSIWAQAMPLSRSYYTFNALGDVVSARFFLRPVTSAQGREDENGNAYALVEERYYNAENRPVMKMSIYRTGAQVNQFEAQSSAVAWAQLPFQIRKAIKDAFGAHIRIGEEIVLPFADLGVYVLRYTPSCSAMPWLKYGDSVLDGALRYLCDYDILQATMETEMYTGRARVIAAKQYQGRKNGSHNNGLDDFMLTKLSGTDTSSPIETWQPDIRAEQLRSIRNMLLENIATAVGLSPSSFAQYLVDSSARTAREVSAEESATALLVENKRELIAKPLADLLRAVLRFNGFTGSASVGFSKAGQTNFSILTDNVTRLVGGGVMSIETAVKMIQPEMDDEQIAAEIGRIKEDKDSMFGDLGMGTAIV